ncbi:unnamed protein product [Symbiodinium pilosum]|uniref:Uncharacterized protein n=1 Tax=Symbiodinium pilosum TaxID=2952 RepID=A0A812YJF5_SYMPI|nr:unnamed protein product [Symbiodinium pilosum]
MWYIRSKPKVVSAFARVWGTEKEDLIVSFDGCCAFRPPSVDHRWRTRAGWFHTDQNGRTTGSDFVCAQDGLPCKRNSMTGTNSLLKTETSCSS